MKKTTFKLEQVIYKNFINKSLEIYGFIHNDEDLSFDIYVNKYFVGYEKHEKERIDQDGKEIHISIPLSDDPHTLKVIGKEDNHMFELFKYNQKDIDKVTVDDGVYVHIDSFIIQDECQVNGYVYSTRKEPITITVTNEGGEVITHSFKALPRTDLVSNHIIDEDLLNSGFYLTFPKIGKTYQITFSDGVFEKTISLEHEINKPKALDVLLPENVKRIYTYIHNYGIAKPFQYIKGHGLKQAFKKFLRIKPKINYDAWLRKYSPNAEELSKQRQTHFDYEPKISLIVACYNTPLNFLQEMIESVLNQTYFNYELCIADGSENTSVKDYIEKNYKNEKIKYVYLNENKGISENMNEAIQLATGDYIGFFDHDDTLAPSALYEMVKAMNEHKEALFFYSDEDKVDEHSTKYFNPNFKPDFNLDLLLTVNYICHFLVVKKSLLDKVGLFRKDFDGAQDYDFILRCVDILKADQIVHIPQILYHWRFHEGSTGGNAQAKTWAFDAGIKALEDYYKRNSIEATVENGRAPGLYRTHYKVIGEPLVSIIIPNKDHVKDLKRCIDSILEKSTYHNYEIIIVENNSTEDKTFEYYKELEKNNQIQVVIWKKPFNYSAINNYGRTFAKGNYILLLNNDTQVISENWLEEMLGLCQRSDVGAVGAKLVYPDHTIQHAGVVIGIEGIAGHVFLNYPEDDLGYNGYIQSVRDYSAVTAACIVVKASVYDEVKGIDEDFQVAFNDIDFCLKIVDHGYRIVYTPYAKLYHFESKSRGEEDNKEKVMRFNSEVTQLLKKWRPFIEQGDPAYNPNLSLTFKNDFNLKADPNENETEWFYKQHGIEL